MTFPDGWTPGTHTYDGTSHPTYRRGSGPGVVVVHEIPGITPDVAAFGEELVDAGYTVVMPSLFGTDGEAMTAGSMLRSLRQVCISREFTKLRKTEARGFRLNIPSGTAVRFEPGQTREVELVEYAGERRVYGFQGRIMGEL